MEMGSNFDALKLLKLICIRQRKREKKTEKESRENQFQTNIKDIIISFKDSTQRCSELQYLGVSTLPL